MSPTNTTTDAAEAQKAWNKLHAGLRKHGMESMAIDALAAYFATPQKWITVASEMPENVERAYRIGWLRGTNPNGWDEQDDVTHGDLNFDNQMREDLESDYPVEVRS